ncbi:MAG: PHP domain-containing protein, partial [Dehalococcoidia bacterium]|nr:PHP domain-containing protein [Dehalococcoidia bacterium]
MIIDLHNHTYPKSDDSFISPDELIIKAKDIGLDGICLTEHDCFWTNDDIELLSSKHNFLILPGVELNTDAGHVLAFGLEHYIFGMHKPEFL